MKKNLLAIALLFMSCTGLFASHLMGGQVTSRNIGGLTYEVTLTAYRDTLGIPIGSTTTFHFSDAAATWTQNDVVAVSAPSVFGNGVEEYTYVDTITFPAAGSYNVYYEDCCRNFAILNMTNAGGESFHLRSTVLADPTNSSPVFLNPPIPIAQLGSAFNYNPLPFDADGDSIVWSLDVPLSSGAVACNGYTLPPSDTTVAFAMNSATGEVSFLPNTLGHFVVSVLVSEYRGGVLIGEIRRDMQIIVINSINSVVSVSSSSNTFPYSGKTFNIAPNAPFTLSISAYDIDNGNVNISAHGEPFQMASNAAVFTVTNGTTTSTGSVTWTPDLTQSRALPYIIALRVQEYYDGYTFESDVTYSLRIGNSATAVIENSKTNEIASIYPNPSQGNFALKMNMTNAGSVTLRVRNLVGQEMAVRTVNVNAGVNVIDVTNLQLMAGKYFISTEQDGKVTSVKGFEIAK